MLLKRIEAAVLGFMYPNAGAEDDDVPALPEESVVDSEQIIREVKATSAEMSEHYNSSRRDAALGLMDDDLVSYVIIEARQGDDESEFDLAIHGQVLAPYMSGIQGAVAEFLSSTHRTPGN